MVDLRLQCSLLMDTYNECLVIAGTNGVTYKRPDFATSFDSFVDPFEFLEYKAELVNPGQYTHHEIFYGELQALLRTWMDRRATA